MLALGYKYVAPLGFRFAALAGFRGTVKGHWIDGVLAHGHHGFVDKCKWGERVAAPIAIARVSYDVLSVRAS